MRFPVPDSMPASTQSASNEQRFAELESRVAFQEHALMQLSDALADSRDEVSRNNELLRRALDDLKSLRTVLYSDPGIEPPPPHY